MLEYWRSGGLVAQFFFLVHQVAQIVAKCVQATFVKAIWVLGLDDMELQAAYYFEENWVSCPLSTFYRADYVADDYYYYLRTRASASAKAKAYWARASSQGGTFELVQFDSQKMPPHLA